LVKDREKKQALLGESEEQQDDTTLNNDALTDAVTSAAM